jgi:hypothetical protein
MQQKKPAASRSQLISTNFFCFSSSSWALLMRILTKESTLQKLLHCELRDVGGGRWEQEEEEEEEDLDLST